jgi:hypothetical protein
MVVKGEMEMISEYQSRRLQGETYENIYDEALQNIAYEEYKLQQIMRESVGSFAGIQGLAQQAQEMLEAGAANPTTYLALLEEILRTALDVWAGRLEYSNLMTEQGMLSIQPMERR